MDELLQEPAPMDYEGLAPLPPETVPPPTERMAAPPPPVGMPQQQDLAGWLNANHPDMARIVRPDGSLIADSYRNIPGAPVPPPPKFDPMQELGRLAYSGNRQAQHAYINALQFQSGLSYREKLQMQRMQAAIGTITNDPGLLFPEKVNAIRQLQTGINFLEHRDKAANMKAMAEKRQLEMDAMKQQAAFMSSIANIDAVERAKLVSQHTVPLPNGGALYMEPGGKTIMVPPAKEGHAFDELKARKLAEEQVDGISVFAPEVIKRIAKENPQALESRLAARNRLVEMKVEGMRADHEERSGGIVPPTARENPQAEYDAIKKRFPGGAKTIQDPAILNRVRELRALGAQ